MKRLETLDARDGTRDAFALLTDAGIPVMALSNGAKNSTKTLLERAGLGDLVEEVVSVDEVKLSKPRAEVYLHAEKAGVKPDELALVAAHPWDINGAAAAGLITAYLAANRPYSRVMHTPDIGASVLPELVRQLIAL